MASICDATPERYNKAAADLAWQRTIRHPCVSPGACAGEHWSGSGGLCIVGTGLPSVPRKLQGHLHREACDAVMNCVAAIAAIRAARSLIVTSDRALIGRTRLQDFSDVTLLKKEGSYAAPFRR